VIPLAPLIPIFSAYTQVSKSQIIVLYNPIFKKNGYLPSLFPEC